VLGRLSQASLEYLKSITADVTLVQGDFDEMVSREYAVRAEHVQGR
jgi:hypothetical protein